MKMRWISIAMILMAMIVVAAGGQSLQFLETEYYVIPLGESGIAADVLVEQVQTVGMSTIVYGVDGVTALRAGEATDATPAEVYLDAQVLVVDADRYQLTIRGEDFTYTVRPAAEGVELVIGTTAPLNAAAVLGEVLGKLQDLGIVGADVGLEYTAYDRNALKGPPTPEGVALDSTLYGMTIAEEWSAYAAEKGFALIGLRVDVVVEKLPGEVIPEAYEAYLVTETEQLAKLLLPVDLMVPLARLSAVGYVRLPYKPAVP